MDNIKSNIKKKLLAKLEKVRDKIRKEKELFISKEHEEICYYYNEYLRYLNKTNMKVKTIVFEYLDDGIEQEFDKQMFLKLRKNKKEIKFNYNSSLFTLDYNDYNKKFINKSQKIIDVKYIQDLIKEQDKFLKSLSLREVFNLKHYTSLGDTIINSFIDNTFNIKKVAIPYTIRSLFFYQFLDYFTMNPIYNGNNVPIDNDTKFILFLNYNYLDFNKNIYKFVIELYIKELKEIFDKAPRNKKKFFVYRGVKDNYIAEQITKNKTRGYFTSNRFTSTSLSFNKAMIFTNTYKNRYIYEISIEEGVPVIFMNGISFYKNEFEILLPINSTFYVNYARKEFYDFKNKATLCYLPEDNSSIGTMVSMSYFDYI